MDNLVLLQSYYHKHDAQMAMGLLKDSGIDAILQSDDAGGFRPHLTLGMGNNRILVAPEDLSRAQDALKTLEQGLSEREIAELEEAALSQKPPKTPQIRINPLSVALAAAAVITVIFILIFRGTR
jgi:hypothetical protein